MKKILLIILFTLLISNGYSQNKERIYLDEHYKEIELREFQKKARTDFFFVAIKSNDTAVFRKLRYRELYGKLDLKVKYQLNGLFHKRYDIDTNKVWVIHYKDSLPDIKKMRKKSGIIVIDSTGKELSEILSWDQYRRSKYRTTKNRHLKKYVTSYGDFIKTIDYEKKYLRNKNLIELLHFYHINKGYPLENDKFNWMQDSSQILKKIFTIGLEMYRIIVLHPDGSFYVITHKDSLDRQKEKIKFKYFQRAKKQWLKDYESIK